MIEQRKCFPEVVQWGSGGFFQIRPIRRTPIPEPSKRRALGASKASKLPSSGAFYLPNHFKSNF